MASLLVLLAPWALKSGPGNGAVSGRVTYVGTPAKAAPSDMSKDPACIKLHPRSPC